MKIVITFILAISMCLVMVACGSTSTSGEPPSSNNSTTNEPKVDASSESSSDKPSSIEETIVYDVDGIKVTAKEIDHSSFMGPEIKFLFENNSDKDVTIQSRHCIVNGYMIDTMMSVDVAAGKKANDGLTLSSSDLGKSGIGKFVDIQFDLDVIDPNNFSTIAKSDMLQLSTDYTGKFTQTYDDSGTPVYEGNGIKVVAKDISTDDIFGQALNVYIENTSDKSIVVQCDSVSVNGFMIDTMFSSTTLPNTRIIDEITFLSSSLEENGIEKIEEIELQIIVINESNFNRIAKPETITITF